MTAAEVRISEWSARLGKPEHDERVRFRGTITDLSATIAGDTLQTAVQATGMLARFGDHYIGDTPWPVETDKARADRIATLLPAQTSFIPNGTPQVNLNARDVDRKKAADCLREQAGWTGSLLWETPDGTVRYDGSEQRGLSEMPPPRLAGSEIVQDPEWKQDMSRFITKVIVEYGLDPGEGAERPVATSGDGLVETKINTELSDAVSAQLVADLIVRRWGKPGIWDAPRVHTTTEILTAGGYESLLALNPGDTLETDMMADSPAVLGPVGKWFLEGWTETWDRRSKNGPLVHELLLSVSDYRRFTIVGEDPVLALSGPESWVFGRTPGPTITATVDPSINSGTIVLYCDNRQVGAPKAPVGGVVTWALTGKEIPVGVSTRLVASFSGVFGYWEADEALKVVDVQPPEGVALAFTVTPTTVHSGSNCTLDARVSAGRTLKVTARNLLLNPSCEGATTGWTPARGTAVATTRAMVSGSTVFDYTSTDGATNGGNYCYAHTAIGAITPGVPYTGYAHYEPKSTVCPSVQAHIQWWDSAGVYLSMSGPGAAVPAAPGTIVRPWVTGVAPTNAAKATVHITPAGAAVPVGDGYYCDAAMLHPGSTPLPYFDGDNPDTETVDYSWRGTPHNSASEQAQVTTGTQYPPGTITWQYSTNGGTSWANWYTDSLVKGVARRAWKSEKPDLNWVWRARYNPAVNSGYVLTTSDPVGVDVQKNVTQVRAYPVAWSQAYDGNGAARSGVALLVQGRHPSGTYGDQRSLAGFTVPPEHWAGWTVTKVEAYLYYETWAQTQGIAKIGSHAYTAAPASAPVITARQNVTGWKPRQGRWVDITGWGKGLATGAIKGIATGPAKSTSAAYYGYAHGKGSRYPTQIRITGSRWQ